MSSAKELLRQARGTPIKKVPGSGSYKEVYSSTFWTLMERVIDDHDRLEKQVDFLHDTIKLANNQSQNAMAEVKRVIEELSGITKTMKALPRPAKAKAKPEPIEDEDSQDE